MTIDFPSPIKFPTLCKYFQLKRILLIPDPETSASLGIEPTLNACPDLVPDASTANGHGITPQGRRMAVRGLCLQAHGLRKGIPENFNGVGGRPTGVAERIQNADCESNLVDEALPLDRPSLETAVEAPARLNGLF